MKKLFSIFILISLLIPSVFAETADKKMKKIREKDRKTVLATLKKEGWKILDNSGTPEIALLEHWQKLDGGDMMEVVGIVSNTKSLNTGQQIAINNAYISYAQQSAHKIRGMVVSEINSGIENKADKEEFYAAYQREIEKEIRNDLRKSFSIYRVNPDGSYDVRIYFLLDLIKAEEAQKRAISNSVEPSV